MKKNSELSPGGNFTSKELVSGSRRWMRKTAENFILCFSTPQKWNITTAKTTLNGRKTNFSRSESAIA
jgi:hypothetical protein